MEDQQMEDQPPPSESQHQDNYTPTNMSKELPMTQTSVPHTTVPIIFAAAAFAAPAAIAVPATRIPPDQANQICTVSAHVIDAWQEGTKLSRRRIAYTCTMPGQDMEALGKLFTADDSIFHCNAIDNNIKVYFHVEEGTWVVEHNQHAGPAGDSAAQCLLGRFREAMAKATGCIIA